MATLMLQAAVGIVLGLFVLWILSTLRRFVDSLSSRMDTGFDLRKSSRTRIDWRILRARSRD
jgi:hypothetical protein